MKGDSVTAIADCKRQQSRPVTRSGPVTNSGIVLLAQQIDDDTFFQGSLQQLALSPSPQSAYELCTSFVPECSRPLPPPPAPPGVRQGDDGTAGYRGISEDELLNRLVV